MRCKTKGIIRDQPVIPKLFELCQKLCGCLGPLVMFQMCDLVCEMISLKTKIGEM